MWVVSMRDNMKLTSSACKFSSMSARSSSRSLRTLDLADMTDSASESSFSCSVVIRALSSSRIGCNFDGIDEFAEYCHAGAPTTGLTSLSGKSD